MLSAQGILLQLSINHPLCINDVQTINQRLAPNYKAKLRSAAIDYECKWESIKKTMPQIFSRFALLFLNSYNVIKNQI